MSVNESLPEGWEEATLDKLVGKGGVFSDGDWIESADQDPKGDVRLVQLADIGDGIYRNRSNRFLTSQKASELDCTFLKTGDLLIARMPDPLGRACLFPGDEKPCVTAVDVCILRSGSDEIDHGWLMAAINSPQFRARIEFLSSGTTRKRISRGNLATIKLPVPPFNEQRRIRARVGELFGRVDASRKRLEQVPRLLKQFRQSVLAAAFSGRLTARWRTQNASSLFQGHIPDLSCESHMPPSWDMARVEEVASIGSGQSSAEIISRCKPEGEVAWFRVGDMNLEGNEKFMRVSQNYLSKNEVKELRLKVFPAGSIIFPKRGGAIATNKKRILVEPSCVDLNVMVLTPNEDMRDYFGVWFLSVNLAALSDGSNVPQINNTDILPLELPRPPLAEQQEIIRRVEVLFKTADAVESHCRKAQDQLDKLPQSILAKAFRGELVSQDPDDEPASTLLERIRGDGIMQSADGRSQKRHRVHAKG